nr:CHASE2 domain-containing protein [Sneathiella glossodoripedis]
MATSHPARDTACSSVGYRREKLLQLGQWPWPRNYLGALVQNATQLGAVVIGFDMVFAEEDRLSPHKVSETVTNLSPKAVEELNALPSFDAVFAKYLAQSRTVLGIAVSPTKSDVNNFGLNRIATVATLGEDPNPYLRNFPGLIGNLEILDEAASGRGMISLDQGFDASSGVCRSPMLSITGLSQR